MRVAVLIALFISSLTLVGLGSYDAQATASSITTYRWVESDGLIAFTDNPKLIPSKYRQEAEVVELSTLAKGRLTHISFDYAQSLQARLDRFRDLNTSARVQATDWPQLSITKTRRINRELLVGGGRVVVVQERRTVDGINKHMYVTYGPDGKELMVTPYPVTGVYQEVPYPRH